MTTAAEKNSVRNNQVINDFGQKIGGAHKDRIREAVAQLQGVDASALLLKPLSKVAKLPNLRALYESGSIDEATARRAWYLWNCIGTKPGASWPSRLQRWAERAAALIAQLADTLAYGVSEKSQNFELPEGVKPAQSWDLFLQEMTAANWPADEYKRGAYFVGHYWMNPARFSIHTEKGSYYTAFDTVAECVKAIRAKVEKNTTKEPQKFSMYQTSAGKYFISPKGKSGIKLLEFDNSADAWAAYGDTEKLGKIYEELKKFPSERRDWNRPRLGEDWRGGQDMTPEAFGEVFPFRGVEFGNWVNQLERAACLNECADALNDLAGVIGIRPEAVALGGSLAWAFGSRGVGKALAHYEPARRVVNLTKKKGNGCVAHEWFHALDNYMMIKSGKPSLMAVSDTHAYGDAEKSPIFEAAKALKNALLKSDMYTRSRRIDAFRSAPYWATVTEMAARGFEAVVFYALQDAGLCNDYLVSIKEATDYTRSECYPYPTREEAAELAPLYRAFIEAAFTEAEREVIKPAAQLPAPPALVTYDPAQPIESAPFQVQDEAPAVAASEPMDANNDPTPADGVQGAAYGGREKSPNPEAYGEELADLVALHAVSKQKHPDALVLFRMGEWYHAYFADAQTVADTTGVIIRKHHGAAMAGFPSHALDSYLPRLIRAGHRVVLVDAPAPKVQEPEPTEAPAPTDGATGAAYGGSEKSPISENLPKSLQEWEKSALRDEVEQIAREMGFTPSRYCPRTLFFLRDKNGKAVRNSKGEALTVSISPSYPTGLNDMPGMWYRKGYIDRVLSSYWSVGVEAHCQEYSAMKYNPTEKPDPERRRMVIDFDWMLEATAENFRRIMEEILIRFRESDPAPTNDPAPTDGATGAAYGGSEKSQISEEVAVSVPEVQEYKLMYLFGGWVCHSRVYVETDAEAIQDATDDYITSRLPRWPYRVALWEGSRLVHVFKEDGPDDIGRRDMEQEESENAPAYIVRDTTEGPSHFDDCATGSILAAVDRVAKNEHTANPHPLQLFADGVKIWDREEYPTEYLAHIVRQRLEVLPELQIVDNIRGLFFETDEGKRVKYNRGAALFHPKRGYLSMKKENGLPFCPIGGAETLRAVLSGAGGTLLGDGIRFVWPCGAEVDSMAPAPCALPIDAIL